MIITSGVYFLMYQRPNFQDSENKEYPLPDIAENNPQFAIYNPQYNLVSHCSHIIIVHGFQRQLVLGLFLAKDFKQFFTFVCFSLL